LPVGLAKRLASYFNTYAIIISKYYYSKKYMNIIFNLKKEAPKMAKSKIAKVSTKGTGRGYGKNPLKSPKAGGPGQRQLPVKA
jgi:hypothetical protein